MSYIHNTHHIHSNSVPYPFFRHRNTLAWSAIITKTWPHAVRLKRHDFCMTVPTHCHAVAPFRCFASTLCRVSPTFHQSHRNHRLFISHRNHRLFLAIPALPSSFTHFWSVCIRNILQLAFCIEYQVPIVLFMHRQLAACHPHPAPPPSSTQFQSVCKIPLCTCGTSICFYIPALIRNSLPFKLYLQTLFMSHCDPLIDYVGRSYNCTHYDLSPNGQVAHAQELTGTLGHVRIHLHSLSFYIAFRPCNRTFSWYVINFRET